MNIIVTGGASGLGEALVSRLRDHAVWILDVNAPAEKLGNHQYLSVDLSDPASIDEAVKGLPASIDALANVAGIAMAAEPEKVLAVNFLGLRCLSEQLIPRLDGSKRIVNVSSIAGRDWKAKLERLEPLLDTGSFAEGLAWCQENREVLRRDPYTFSKRVVTAYTLRAAGLGVQQGFTVNCVSPGPIDTPLYPQFETLMSTAHSDWTITQTRRIADANDIAEVVDMLLTGACGWLNGVDIPVDGGYTAGLDSGWIDFSQSPMMLERAARS